jgi:hypothetical protein
MQGLLFYFKNKSNLTKTVVSRADFTELFGKQIRLLLSFEL